MGFLRRVSFYWGLPLLVWGAVVQAVFLFIQVNIADSFTASLSTVLRSEIASSNFDYLSRALLDLQTLGNLRCLEVNLTSPTRLPITRFGEDGCFEPTSFLSLRGHLRSVTLSSESGAVYEVRMRTENGTYFAVALWSFRVLGLLLLALVKRLFEVRHRIQMQILGEEKRRVDDLRRFAAQLAHDIRSPLSAVKIASATLPDTARKQRALIDAATERIQSLTTKVLVDYRRGPELAPPWLFSEVMESLVAEFRVQCADRGIQLEFIREGDCHLDVIDRSEFQRLTANIVSNCLDALENQSAGRIRIQAEAVESRLQIEFVDNGSGIEPGILEILNQGIRDVSSKSGLKASGFALGSSHARKLIRENGGSLHYSSRKDEGTRVTLTLPTRG